MKYLIRIILVCFALVILGIFDQAVNNPIITTFLLGFYVYERFSSWGLHSLGILFALIIQAFIIYNVIKFVLWLFFKFKNLFKQKG